MKSFHVRAALQRLGADVRTARLRRRLSVADFCQRIGVTDKTLAKLERGDGGVRLETLAAALLAIGELHRLESLLDPASDDVGLGLDRNDSRSGSPPHAAGPQPQRSGTRCRTTRRTAASTTRRTRKGVLSDARGPRCAG